MKKILLSILYTFGIVFVVIVLYLIISTHITFKFYGYERLNYSHEMDFIFNAQTLNHIKVEAFYKSGEKGSVCFLNLDTLSKIAIIEATNFQDILLDDVQYESIDDIKKSQITTYVSIVNNYSPLISQALNPKESAFLRILFEKPYQIELIAKEEKCLYLKGNFKHGAFRNTQNCSLITYRGNANNELLILKHEKKLYFIMQTASNISLLEIINPDLIAK